MKPEAIKSAAAEIYRQLRVATPQRIEEIISRHAGAKAKPAAPKTPPPPPPPKT